MKRVDPLAREETEHDELEDRKRSDAHAHDGRASPASCRRTANDREARTRQRNAKASGLSPSVNAVSPDRRAVRRDCRARSAAEHGRKRNRVAVQAGEERRRRADSEDAGSARPPARPTRGRAIDAKSTRRRHGRAEHERHVADDRGRQVVEQAVGGKGIVAGVPEVVPEEGAVANEERPVEVDRRVAGRRAEGEEREPPGSRSARWRGLLRFPEDVARLRGHGAVERRRTGRRPEHLRSGYGRPTKIRCSIGVHVVTVHEDAQGRARRRSQACAGTRRRRAAARRGASATTRASTCDRRAGRAPGRRRREGGRSRGSGAPSRACRSRSRRRSPGSGAV